MNVNMVFNLDAETITAFLATAVALFFMYFPGVRVPFAGLTPETKSLIMLGLLLVVTVTVMSLGCAGAITVPGLACDIGFWPLVFAGGKVFLLAVAANQGTHRIFPEPQDVKNAKNARYLEDYKVFQGTCDTSDFRGTVELSEDTAHQEG
jgi:hypothetical protein